ncbi:putative RNA polymerase II subunit B1 CTD phosphatase RPAP2 isoform X1 [Alligator mississippiensis]|uniref:putative RNA polymerase II subunit B1 CTD phosphatase RPAP2 isoform X1 n=1 Tax=Alligator mississippiensis TaxID=8496 RepID=UPI0007114127|nr:putative RNA polymerase II subunit B1 CTD phosphatase RPAP2 isoform X1 [Alligator mississippiensis]
MAAREKLRVRSGRRRPGSKQSSALKNEDAAQRKVALEAAIRKKIEFEKKALHIVEQLLEEDITEEFLLNCGKLITPSHYKDAVDERSIIKLCGYPLCQNKLEHVPKQKYRISTKTNKVYDITERKCFCSNFCYRASKYFEAQISKCPVWMREEERPPDIELLKEGQSGQSGEEVKLRDEVIKVSDIENPMLSSQCESGSPSIHSDSSSDTELEFVSSILPRNQSGTPSGTRISQKSILSKKHDQEVYSKPGGEDSGVIEATEQLSTCKLDSLEKKSTCSVRFQNKLTDISSKNVMLENGKISESCENSCNSSHVVFLGVSKKGAEQLKRILTKSKQHIKPTLRPVNSLAAKGNLLEVLKQTFIEWRTGETLKFLYDSKYVPVCLPEHTLAVACEREELDEDDIETADDLNDTAMWKSKNTLPFASSDGVVKPLPSYKKLKEETQLLELRVKEFYKGKYILAEETAAEVHEEEYFSSHKDNQEDDPTFPLIDSNAQMQIRKRIVLERLRKVLPAVLGPLQITLGEVYMELKSLVSTFRLTNINIIHKMPEWTLIAIVLLSTLSQSIPVFENSQQSPVYTQFLSTLLEELHFTNEDLESLTRIFRKDYFPECK